MEVVEIVIIVGEADINKGMGGFGIHVGLIAEDNTGVSNTASVRRRKGSIGIYAGPKAKECAGVSSAAEIRSGREMLTHEAKWGR